MKKQYMKPHMATYAMQYKHLLLLSGPGAGDQQNPVGPGEARENLFDDWGEEEEETAY